MTGTSGEATPISAEEAIRRIQERDHVLPPGKAVMDFAHEQALILLIKDGVVSAGLTPDGQLAFGRGPNWGVL